jgi:uncharacterized protein (DUF1800 family)
MTIALTEDQRRTLEKENDAPVRVAVGDRDYVLVRADVFEQMKALLEAEEVDPSLYEFDEAAHS